MLDVAVVVVVPAVAAPVEVVLTASIWALYPDKMGADAIDHQLCVAIVSLVVMICAAIW